MDLSKLNLSKVVAAGDKHRVLIPQHANLIHYEVQVWSNGWITMGKFGLGLEGFSDCKKMKTELIASGERARIIAFGEVD